MEIKGRILSIDKPIELASGFKKRHVIINTGGKNVFKVTLINDNISLADLYQTGDDITLDIAQLGSPSWTGRDGKEIIFNDITCNIVVSTEKSILKTAQEGVEKLAPPANPKAIDLPKSDNSDLPF